MSSVKRRIAKKKKELEKIRRFQKQSDEITERYKKIWKEKGPIWFAEHILTCPVDVPTHPDFDPNNNSPIFCSGCEREHPKFRENGTPYHIILSDYQKKFLIDLWKGKYKLSLVSASRGSGKTFILAVWCCWLLTTHDKYSINYMGGSMRQSKICQSYIDDWRYDVPLLYKIIDKSLKGIDRYATTIWRGQITFSACSSTSARGPHVNEVCLDEVATAEDKSEEGSKAVKAAMWQVTGKRVSRLIMASTAHFVGGMFYEYLNNPKKYGFTVYQWAIAKHVSGKKPLETYMDKDPKHWRPNVWWLTQEEIEKFRRTKSDEEFLCEGLGGASLASGAVFKKKDLDVCICGMCGECDPYVWGKCPLVELAKLGTKEDPIKYIIERRAGFDYGVSEAPCALTILGRKKDMVFILFNEEQIGLREEEKVSWIHDNCQRFKTWTFIPDPAVSGQNIYEILGDRGYSVYVLAEHEKMGRVYNLINFVEKHKIIIPKAFWYLTQSLRKLAWDKNGKIRKVDDHSADSLCYGLEDFSVEESNILEEYMKIKKPTIDELWGVK